MNLNLFSIFDPNSNLLILNIQLNWLSSLLPYIFIPLSYWFTTSRYESFLLNLTKNLFNEFKILMKKNFGNLMMFLSLFYYILIINLMGLSPYIFTSSSHLTFTLAFSIPMWTGIIWYTWRKYPIDSLAHMVPSGTPPMLMMFMVMIETISNIIRPLTLSVRLSANMIAGHLLLTLIGSLAMKIKFLNLIIVLSLQTLLMILEIAVSMIQAYVFTILIILYTIEIDN